MEFFLSRIARSLKDEFGNNLNRHCLVFPGRRAGLYLIKYLSAGLEKPIWVPATNTINDLFKSCSNLQLASNEILLFELFRIYSSIRKDAGSFDDFYFWGDMLINDFDDTDKYLADASHLFVNIRDLKEIDQRFGGLTEEQKEIVRQFWMNFDISKTTEQKDGFISLWAVLNELYVAFRKSLREQNLAYEGMIFREVAELNDDEIAGAISWDMVHFIGFNALNNCEKRLMKALKKEGKARFYWDYDNSFIAEGQHNSAGLFMRENLKMFGNDMPGDWSYTTMLSSGTDRAKRVVYETSSDVAQVKLVPDLLQAIPGLSPENAHQTAVVLSDETLLIPLLSSLPEKSLDINITMGYPLRQTMVYTFVRHLMELQRTAVVSNGECRFFSTHVLNILRHPILRGSLSEDDYTLVSEIISCGKIWFTASDFSSSGFLSAVFLKHTLPASLSTWLRDILSTIALQNDGGVDEVELNMRNEFIYRIVLSLNKLDSIIRNPAYSFSADTFLKLLDRMLSRQTVPFSGEPLSGIQVMGILETRALDFKNLIILSVNEGVMPALSSTSSFIPFSLRQAFGLPSVNHQESIFAYHFYRLLQRAENVTFTYNSNSEGLRSGEMSRFLIQMNYDRKLKPSFMNTGFEIKSSVPPSSTVVRTREHTEMLQSRFLSGNGRVLSPSAINTWINCRMKFFYRYVSGIREPDKISGEIDPAMFGNILHEVMRRLYSEYCGRTIDPRILDGMLKDEALLRKNIEDAIREKFNIGLSGTVSGNELIVRDVLFTYVRRIIQVDRSIAPLTILNLEQYLDFNLDISISGIKTSVRAGGYADRIDRLNGITRIVDYKTGRISDSLCAISNLFTEERKDEYEGWFQVLLYCEAYLMQNSNAIVKPSIYKIKKLTGKTVQERLFVKEGRSETEISDYRDIRAEFISGVQGTVEKIFDPLEPFTMTNQDSRCKYCAYNELCSR